MKQDKKFKSNIKYYTTSEAFKFIGLGLILLSVVLYFVGSGWSFWSWLILSIGTPIGFILFLISTGRSSDEEINTYIKLHTKEISADDISFEKGFKKRVLDRCEPIYFEGYDFDGDVMVAKAKNGRIVSSIYTRAIIFPLDTGIHISYKTISIISDDVKEDSVDIDYSDIQSFKMDDQRKQIIFGKKTFTPRDIRLVINYSDDKTITLPMQDNMDTENFIKKINDMMKKAKESSVQ